ncbi:MAG: hypothetical protein ROR55_05730 [Devosia sp.]
MSLLLPGVMLATIATVPQISDKLHPRANLQICGVQSGIYPNFWHFLCLSAGWAVAPCESVESTSGSIHASAALIDIDAKNDACRRETGLGHNVSFYAMLLRL